MVRLWIWRPEDVWISVVFRRLDGKARVQESGQVQVFLDGLFERNAWDTTAGGKHVDRKGAGSEACERETDSGEGYCRGD